MRPEKLRAFRRDGGGQEKYTGEWHEDKALCSYAFGVNKYTQRPQRGLPYVIGPFGRAFLIPRPMGVVGY